MAEKSREGRRSQQKALTVPVRLQMVSVPIAIRADLLQNTHQASPLLAAGLLLTIQSLWR